MKFFDYLKNIFIILIFLQLAPTLVQNIHKQYSRYIMPRTRVGLVEIKGVLYNSDHYNKYLNRYFKDKSIKGILIKMECPGTASATAYAIFNEILTLKKEYPSKPIITLVENTCASGGYYIACATDAIIAPASALIGSIGAKFPYLFQLQELIEQHNIKYESVAAGKHKNAVDPFIALNATDKAMLQSVVDDLYDKFLNDVVRTRKLSLTNQQEWADGKIFTGRQALKIGLIDAIGSANTAVEKLKDAGMIKGELEWVRPVQRTGFFSLFGKAQDDDQGNSMFSLIGGKLQAAFTRYLSQKIY